MPKLVDPPEEKLDELLSYLKDQLLTAYKEDRQVSLEWNRELHEVPSNTYIRKYESTGEVTITIHIGMKRGKKGKMPS